MEETGQFHLVDLVRHVLSGWLPEWLWKLIQILITTVSCWNVTASLLTFLSRHLEVDGQLSHTITFCRGHLFNAQAYITPSHPPLHPSHPQLAHVTARQGWRFAARCEVKERRKVRKESTWNHTSYVQLFLSYCKVELQNYFHRIFLQTISWFH